MRTMKALCGAILALGLAIGTTAPASASTPDEDLLQANAAIANEDDLGLLVTPEELVSLGADRADIVKQAKLFATMSQAEKDHQQELREEQAQVAELLADEPDVPVEAPNPPATPPGTISPAIFLTWCWPGNDHYSVFWTSLGNNVVDCFAGGAGTYYPSIGSYPGTKSIRPGNHVGRVYYYSSPYFYWSPWRGKSMDTYYFTGSGVNAERIQLQ